MGLTWIDHDTIDKPIEELSVGTAAAEHIEFTVETLKSAKDSGSSSSLLSAGSKKEPAGLMGKKVNGRI